MKQPIFCHSKQGGAGFCLALLGVLAALAGHNFIGPARAGEARPYVLIVDATASMRGRLRRKRKLSIVQDALAGFIATAPEQTPLALLSYGGEPKHYCEDVAELVPLGPLSANRAALETAVEDIRPRRGRTPHIAAIRRAARMLGEPAKGGVILFSGGAEDCAEDACAAAQAIHKSYPGLRVHIIALGAREATINKLECIAAATGGLFREIRTGPEGREALREILGSETRAGAPGAAPWRPAGWSR